MVEQDETKMEQKRFWLVESTCRTMFVTKDVFGKVLGVNDYYQLWRSRATETSVPANLLKP